MLKGYAKILGHVTECTVGERRELAMPDINDKERAKLIVLAIIREAGGELDNKTNLFKAFYYAHLHYTKNTGGFLSAWPIVRMPRGPGIHDSDTILGELMVSGDLHVAQIQSGQHHALRFRLTDKGRCALEGLSSEDSDAIAKAVREVYRKTAARVSDESHLVSKSWHDTPNGKELAIYADLLTPEEYAASREHTKQSAEAFRKRRG
jgi:hypothetical protein